MRAIDMVACTTICIAGLCHASTDPQCLKHLGGAFGDVECFNGLSNDLKKENNRLAVKLSAIIPKPNRNATLFNKYLKTQADAPQFCELSRASMTGWQREAETVNPRYHDYDVAYYACVYSLLEQENKFLKTLIKNSSQE